MAAAEVRISGFGRFGVDYEDRPGTAAVVGRVPATPQSTADATVSAAGVVTPGAVTALVPGTVASTDAQKLAARNAVAAAQAALAAAATVVARENAAADLADAEANAAAIVGAAAVPGTSHSSLTSRLRLQFDMSTETDGGVTFGARFRVQAESRDGVAGTGGFNGARFFVSANGLTLGVGNIVGAFEAASGLYMNTTSAGIGIDGSGLTNVVGNMAGVSFNWDAYSSAGTGVNGVEAIYSAGNWGVHVSYSDATSRAGNVITNGETNTAISAYYTFGDWTIAAAHNAEDRLGALVDRDLTFVSLSGDLGFMNLTVAYAKGENYIALNRDSSKVGIYGEFDIGAATKVAAYVTDEDSPGRPTDGTGYGIDITHDLGGGASLVFGANESSNDVTTVQAGAFFRF